VCGRSLFRSHYFTRNTSRDTRYERVRSTLNTLYKLCIKRDAITYKYFGAASAQKPPRLGGFFYYGRDENSPLPVREMQIFRTAAGKNDNDRVFSQSTGRGGSESSVPPPDRSPCPLLRVRAIGSSVAYAKSAGSLQPDEKYTRTRHRGRRRLCETRYGGIRRHARVKIDSSRVPGCKFNGRRRRYNGGGV